MLQELSHYLGQKPKNLQLLHNCENMQKSCWRTLAYVLFHRVKAKRPKDYWHVKHVWKLFFKLFDEYWRNNISLKIAQLKCKISKIIENLGWHFGTCTPIYLYTPAPPKKYHIQCSFKRRLQCCKNCVNSLLRKPKKPKCPCLFHDFLGWKWAIMSEPRL